VTLKGEGHDPNMSHRSILLKTAGDTNSVIMEHLQEMVPGVSNGHMTADITWPWQDKVKVVAQMPIP